MSGTGEVVLRPVGVVRSPRTDVRDTTGWGSVTARIELVEGLGGATLTGLEDFSHVEVVLWFDRVVPRDSYDAVAPPRGRSDLPAVGVFASRGPNRPNPLGVSACRLLEVVGSTLTVAGLDAVDGTPVLDLKPVMAALLPQGVGEPAWSERLMRDYYTG